MMVSTVWLAAGVVLALNNAPVTAAAFALAWLYNRRWEATLPKRIPDSGAEG